MEKYRVAIVIPALNESNTISKIVGAVRQYGIPIIVDDGSTDDTADLSRNAGGVVIVHDINQGYDAALNSGFKKSLELGAEVIVTLDADGQHNPALIHQFVNEIDAGADVVVGQRNKRQRLTEHIFAWYSGICFGVNDPLCGMKAYRMSLYNQLGHFDSYGSVGTELLFFAAKKGYKIKQIPIQVRERSDESRFGKMFLSNCRIARAMIFSVCR